MNTRTLRKRPTVQLPTLPRLLLLALFFLAGVLLGQVLSGRVPDTTGDELRRYLEDYVRLGGEGAPTVQTALSALVIYFRYPLFAFLLGFASIGVVLLPCVTAAYGFFLSFSVCCFTAAFGVDGVLLAAFLCYVFCCAISVCAVVWVLLSEMYPIRVRGAAMSIAGFALWVGTYLVGQLTPWMLANLTPAGTFFLFAAMCVPYMLLIWKAVPETSGRTLEEIERYWTR